MKEIVKKIKKNLQKKFFTKKVYISETLENLMIIVVSNYFENMSLLERQKNIYKVITGYITDKTIHSVSIKTYTLNEWKKQKNIE
ncbi:hypothetical protein AOQ89_02290 [bacterium endosymbiont of Pedicinus badii]|nr:hypothetical protein AOQ89_02290 [bacterium endosymbiont of Pedicinus badii]